MDRRGTFREQSKYVLALLISFACLGTQSVRGQVFGEQCTVSVNGQTAVVNADGSFTIDNVLGGANLFRVMATCTENGVTLFGVSEFFQIVGGQDVTIEGIALSPFPPPSVLGIVAVPLVATLTSKGETTQIVVTADLSDGTTPDVSPRSEGSAYTSSNDSVASVDNEGVVTAIANGTALITVTNQGSTSVARVLVSVGDPLTVIEGFVQLADGTPVEGAVVELLDLGLTDVTGPDGQFCLGCVGGGAPTEEKFLPFDIFTQADVGGETLSALTSNLPPVPGGITDAGVIALGASTFWFSDSDGSWNDPAQWSTGAVPGIGDDVIINRGGVYEVELDTNASVASLLFDSSLSSFFALQRNLTVAGPSLIESGTVKWFGSDWTGGGLENRGRIEIERASTLPSPFLQSGTLTIEAFGGTNSTLTVNGGMTNEGDLFLGSTSGTRTSTLVVTGGPLINTDDGRISIIVQNGGFRVMNADVENEGVVAIERDVTFTSGTTQVNRSEWSIAANEEAVMDGVTFRQNAGTLQVDGELSMDGGSFVFEGGEILGVPLLETSSLELGASAGTGSFLLRDVGNTLIGNVGPNHSFKVEARGGTSASIASTSPFTCDGTITLGSTSGTRNSTLDLTNGLMTIGASGVLEAIVDGGGTRTVTGDFVNGGSVDIERSTTFTSGANIINDSAWSIDAGATATMDGVNYTQRSGSTTVSGDLDMADGNLLFEGGDFLGVPPNLTRTSLTIHPGAEGAGSFLFLNTENNLIGDVAAAQTLEMLAQGGTSAELVSASGFENRGRISLNSTSGTRTSSLVVTTGTLTNAATGILETINGNGGLRTIDADIVNAGVVNLARQVTFVAGSALINDATWTIEPSVTATMNGTSFTQRGGTLQVDGEFLMTSGSFDHDGGQVIGAPVLTGSALSIGNGSIGAASFRMRNLGNTLSGDLAAGQEVTVEAVPGTAAELQWQGGATNAGRVNVVSNTGVNPSTLEIQGGTLLNAAGGVLDFQAGAGATRLFTGDVVNEGTITVDQRTTFNAGSTVTNRGSLDVTASAEADWDGSSLIQESGTVDVSGTFEMDGGTLQLDGGTITGTVEMTDSALVIGASSTAQANVHFFDIANTLSGDVVAGQTLRIEASGGTSATLTSATAFTNQGTIVLGSSAVTRTSELLLTSGVLTNDATGRIDVLSESGGSRKMSAAVENAGTVFIDRAIDWGVVGAVHTNEGSFDVRQTVTLIGTSFTNQLIGVVEGDGVFDATQCSLINQARFEPAGSSGAGTLGILGDWTQGASGELAIEIGGLGSFDLLDIGAQAILDGRLEISLIDGYVPVLGDTFDVVTFGSRTGVFATVDGLQLGGGLEFALSYEAGSVRLEVVASAP